MPSASVYASVIGAISFPSLAMTCTIGGVLRGLLADGTATVEGMKAGDVDPRGKKEYCDIVSDKALAIAGGVLEAVLHLYTDRGEF